MLNPSSFLTKECLSQSRVIAKGNKIREIEQLVNEYGGSKKNWVKKSTPVILIDGKNAEIHWYEHYGIGRVKEKIKWL